jgi:hypothetical protein
MPDARKQAKTATPGVYRRGNRFVVRWKYRGQSERRYFPTYAEDREFKRTLSGAGKQPTTGQTVGEYYAAWIETYRGRTSRGLEETTRDSYRDSIVGPGVQRRCQDSPGVFGLPATDRKGAVRVNALLVDVRGHTTVFGAACPSQPAVWRARSRPCGVRTGAGPARDAAHARARW